MLGLRLDPGTDQELSAFARRSRRTKSDIARAAIVEYLDRHAADDGFAREIEAIAEQERASPVLRAELDETDAIAWRTVNTLP